MIVHHHKQNDKSFDDEVYVIVTDVTEREWESNEWDNKVTLKRCSRTSLLDNGSNRMVVDFDMG